MLKCNNTKTGQFSDPLIWKVANSNSCKQSPDRWWLSFGFASQLLKAAVHLLSMPATATIVERCNKAYASQKSKVRNRLTPERAAKLAIVSFNACVQRKVDAACSREAGRSERMKKNYVF